MGGELSSPELVARELIEDEICCFATPDHPLATKRRVQVAALASQTWIVREKGSATRQLFEAWLEQAGGGFHKTIEVRGAEDVKVLVEAGLGISFFSIHGLARELEERRLTQLRLAGLPLRRPIYLVRHADKRVSPVMAAFREIVRD